MVLPPSCAAAWPASSMTPRKSTWASFICNSQKTRARYAKVSNQRAAKAVGKVKVLWKHGGNDNDKKTTGTHDAFCTCSISCPGLPLQPDFQPLSLLRRRLPQPARQMADRLCRRRPGGHRRAHHVAMAVGQVGPAVRGREPH